MVISATLVHAEVLVNPRQMVFKLLCDLSILGKDGFSIPYEKDGEYYVTCYPSWSVEGLGNLGRINKETYDYIQDLLLIYNYLKNVRKIES